MHHIKFFSRCDLVPDNENYGEANESNLCASTPYEANLLLKLKASDSDT
jgi:hypothetical protein